MSKSDIFDKKVRLKSVELIVYDFDGVMTDNSAIVGEDGKEYVKINRSDGLAVSLIKEAKIPQIVLSTESNDVVLRRAEKLKLPVFNDIKNKKKSLMKYCNDNNVKLSNVIYIGNDINDLEVMKLVGYAICPADASEEIKAVSKIRLQKKGGEGVVRELLYYLNINI